MTAAYRPAATVDSVVDLSHNNALPDPHAAFRAAIGGGIAAIMHKATQGTGFVDKTFAARRTAAADVGGLLFGAYHFCDGSDPAKQGDHFLSEIGDPTGLVLALDAERNKSQVTVAEVVLIASRIFRRIGTWPVIYIGRAGPDGTGHGLPNKILAACPLWLPEYGNNPVCPPGWSKWRMWQHTDGHVGSAVAPVPGIGHCDRSRFAGTSAELHAWWAATAVKR